MLRQKICRRQFGLSLAATLAAGPLARAQASDAPRTLRVGLITPPPHNWTRSAAAFGEALAEATDGRLSLSIFPSGQLGNESQMLQLLQIGALDFGFFTTSQFANRLNAFAAFYTPYVATDATHAAAVLQAPVTRDILADVERIGLHGLGFGMAGMRQIVSSRQVDIIRDLKGLKTRVVPDAPLTDFWRLVGAAPSPIPLSSLYDAFANGQIDAMHIDFENTLRLKFYAHARDVLHTDHMIFPMVAVASRRSWQSFSTADQGLIKSLLDKELAALRGLYADADLQFRDELITLGANVKRFEAGWMAEAAEAWEERWAPRTPFIAALKAAAEGLRTGEAT
ncbi:MAG: TRAP transporter substrate-binding protein [Hyphomonadaceae bacterium]|nr:TRAP transporter substrate-binding protein [Hyphomonadaceae bacterium]